MEKEYKECLYCKDDFEVKDKRQKFCNNIHRQRYYYEKNKDKILKKVKKWRKEHIKERKEFDRKRYQKYKDKFKQNSRNWKLKNPERVKIISSKSFKKFYTEKHNRFLELMRNQYKNNKHKWDSRSKTGRYIKDNKRNNKPELELLKKCKHCGSTEGLKLRILKYVKYTKDIKREIENGNIFMLCKECHRKDVNNDRSKR